MTATAQTKAQELAGQVADSNEALELLTALRNRFEWSGTMFTPDDVESQVEEALEGKDEYLAAYSRALRDEVLGSYEYRKLDDQMSEGANEALYEAALSSPLLMSTPAMFERPDDAITYCVVLGNDDANGVRTETLEVGPYNSLKEAHEVGVSSMGCNAEQVEEKHGVFKVYTMTADEELTSGPMKGFTLVVIRDGETLAQYPATVEQSS